VTNGRRRYYGKYRGTVTDNLDLLMQGRIRAKVPAVLGDEETGWALPSSPFGGSGVGFFSTPSKGANVWIEFEGGNPDHPIWSGSFWGLTEAPVQDPLNMKKVLKTDTVTITVDDTPGIGGVTIELKSGAKIVMGISGITLSCGSSSIKVTPASVTVNDGALEVT
jgi:hypothetical protein